MHIFYRTVQNGFNYFFLELYIYNLITYLIHLMDYFTINKVNKIFTIDELFVFFCIFLLNARINLKMDGKMYDNIYIVM